MKEKSIRYRLLLCGRYTFIVYTTAVYQSDDKREEPSLMVMDQDLYLSYGNDEPYIPATEDDVQLTENHGEDGSKHDETSDKLMQQNNTPACNDPLIMGGICDSSGQFHPGGDGFCSK